MAWTLILRVVLLSLSFVAASALPPSHDSFNKRQSTCTGNNLTVDLGYAIYRGSVFSSTLNTWFGMRFAAPPTGTRRWALPATPATSRASATPANADPGSFSCPQSSTSPYVNPSGCPTNLQNLSTVPAACQAQFYSEDCLFLNVVSPVNATNLPVLVNIHGGGYGAGNGALSVAPFQDRNNDKIIVVTIQYRLHAFGFLSSSQYKNAGGALNVGLYDQQFALKWVQQHICKFGGDPSKVTISGNSAGGGSVMLQSLAMGGTLNNTYFRYGIANSPYLPKQYKYGDQVPTSYYVAFVDAVGCTGAANPLACLRGKDSKILQLAAQRISGSGLYGTFTFVPVTDGTFLRQRPTQQLYHGSLNGAAILTNNVANEADVFIAQNVTTYADFRAYARLAFPNVTYSDLAANYQVGNASDVARGRLFATDGLSTPTALNQSSVATGQQQRVNDLYAESTFVCPSYWLADGFARLGKPAYKSQWSVPPALHGTEYNSYFSDPTDTLPDKFQVALSQMWGNFIISGNPSISNEIANGHPNDHSPNPASNWTQWTVSTKVMMNVNETGGSPSTTTVSQPEYTTGGVPINKTPRLVNSFQLVDAISWEGGRGHRCAFWKAQGPNVPE